MSLFDEHALRTLVAEEVRKVVREELGKSVRSQTEEYLPVAEAARIAAVVPETIREWIHRGHLPGYHAGRELRVRRSELERRLATPAERDDAEVTPEEHARQFLSRRAHG